MSKTREHYHHATRHHERGCLPLPKRRRNGTKPRSTKRLRTMHTWLMGTINTRFITMLRLQDCTPSTAMAWRFPLPGKRRIKRVWLRRGSIWCPHYVGGDSGSKGGRGPISRFSNEQVRRLLGLLRKAAQVSSRPAPLTRRQCYGRFPRY